MNIKFDGDAYYIREKIDNQTLEMGFQEEWDSKNHVLYYNVYVSVYNKRKHMTDNEAKKAITGANPIKNALVARKAFKALERYVLAQSGENDVIIYAHWVSNRRRDAYYRVLSKWGYTYQYVDGIKVIARRFTKEEIHELS